MVLVWVIGTRIRIFKLSISKLYEASRFELWNQGLIEKVPQQILFKALLVSAHEMKSYFYTSS